MNPIIWITMIPYDGLLFREDDSILEAGEIQREKATIEIIMNKTNISGGVVACLGFRYEDIEVVKVLDQCLRVWVDVLKRYGFRVVS